MLCGMGQDMHGSPLWPVQPQAGVCFESCVSFQGARLQTHTFSDGSVDSIDKSQRAFWRVGATFCCPSRKNGVIQPGRHGDASRACLGALCPVLCECRRDAIVCKALCPRQVSQNRTVARGVRSARDDMCTLQMKGTSSAAHQPCEYSILLAFIAFYQHLRGVFDTYAQQQQARPAPSISLCVKSTWRLEWHPSPLQCQLAHIVRHGTPLGQAQYVTSPLHSRFTSTLQVVV